MPREPHVSHRKKHIPHVVEPDRLVWIPKDKVLAGDPALIGYVIPKTQDDAEEGLLPHLAVLEFTQHAAQPCASRPRRANYPNDVLGPYVIGVGTITIQDCLHHLLLKLL